MLGNDKQTDTKINRYFSSSHIVFRPLEEFSANVTQFEIVI